MLRCFSVALTVWAVAVAGTSCGGSEAADERPVAGASTGSAPETTSDAGPTVLDVIHTDPQYASLARLVDEGPQIFRGAMEAPSWDHTVLAPTEEAFTALPPGTVERLITEDQGAVHAILDNLLIDGIVRSDTLRDGGTYQTFEDALPVRVEGDRITIGPATVIEADIEASNGLVHAINAVPIPDLVRERVLGTGE